MIEGFATPEGTLRYCQRHQLPQAAMRLCMGNSLSTVGVGTYGHTYDSKIEKNQRDALVGLLTAGCNVIDTAPNYFNGNAEINTGVALAYCVKCGIIKRDEVFISTKAGLLSEPEINGTPFYNFDPDFLLQSIKNSLKRLDLESVDCVFLHNLELLRVESPSDFVSRVTKISDCMNEAVSEGLARSWGVSSWDGFRVPPTSPLYLDIQELRSIGGANFRYLQFPLGLWANEAITEAYQKGKTSVQAADGLGLFGNSPLLQGELLPLLTKFAVSMEEAVCFARDTKGINVVLLGIKNPEHISSWITIQKKYPFTDQNEISKKVYEKLGA